MWSVRWLLAVAATLVPLVSAMPDGVPRTACESMRPRGPGHHDAQPQDSPMPYDVVVSNADSQVVQITISQTHGGPSFLGFMVQARAAASDTPLGTFGSLQADLVKTITCASHGDTASHTNSEPKTTVSLAWTPPSDYLGKVVFFVTIVEIPSTFWVHQEVGSFFLN